MAPYWGNQHRLEAARLSNGAGTGNAHTQVAAAAAPASKRQKTSK
jgi:hypothetical protein